MRELNECKAEVFRRSDNRIKERRRNRNRILAMCIPLCLVLTIFSVMMLPGMLPAGRDKAPEADGLSGNATSGDRGDQGNNEGVYKVLITGFSDGHTTVSLSREYEFADFEKYKDQTPESKKRITINQQEYIGTYSKSVYRGRNYYPVYVYSLPGTQEFSIDDKGLLTSFWWGGTSSVDKNVTLERKIQIAKDFMSDIVDISKYQITSEVDEEITRVTFTKFVKGIKTAETATVKLKNNGELYSYSSFMLGRISDNIIESTPNIEVITQVAQNRLESMYKDVKKNYSKIEYETEFLELTLLKDGTVGFICTMEVDCFSPAGDGFYFVYSQLIHSVVCWQDNKLSTN